MTWSQIPTTDIDRECAPDAQEIVVYRNEAGYVALRIRDEDGAWFQLYGPDDEYLDGAHGDIGSWGTLDSRLAGWTGELRGSTRPRA